MEVMKRKHRKMKTAAQLKLEIEALRAELEKREHEERLKIGKKMQEWTGAETWDEIEAILKGGRATELKTVSETLGQSQGNSEGR